MTERRIAYVSSKLRHRDMWLASGIETVSSWIIAEEPSQDQYSAMWDRYRDEILRCDAIVLYVEPQDQLKGCMLELGMAFMVQVPIVIVWTGTIEALAAKIGTVVYHQSVQIVGSIDDARQALQ